MTGADFWSRRRAAVAAEDLAEKHESEAAQREAVERELAERPDAELLAEAGQPAPEALDSPEAVRDFLASALPNRLKSRALRRLWTLNPLLANVDGLVDYGEDFTDSAMAVEAVQTAYQVGRGMLKHVTNVPGPATPAPCPDTEPDHEALPEHSEPVASDGLDPPTRTSVAEPEETSVTDEANAPLADAPVGRQRMSFTFDPSPA